MTCIAVKREKNFIHLCGDTQVSIGHHKRASSFKDSMKDFCKIEQVGDVYFGHSGWIEDAVVFKEYARTHTPKGERLDDMESYILGFYKFCKDRNSDFKLGNDRGCMFLIVYKGKVYFIWDYLIYEVDKYDAIGSGIFYAKTAMYLGKSAKEAVDVAREFAGGVGGETNEIKIPYN